MVVKNVSPNSKKLGAFSIWATGVGIVISGISFGWNIGWGITGPFAFFLPVLIAAIMYYALVQCLTELACVYPDTTGPHIYVRNAYGKFWGGFIALAILFEFLFATPAIASSLGEYIGFLKGDLQLANWFASFFIGIFCIVNIFDLSIGVKFIVALTLIAIIELFIYSSSIFLEFKGSNIINSHYDKFDFESLIKASPFAIWMFLGIEGVSLMTKNIKEENFKKTIQSGYNYAIWTLIILAFLVLILASGSIEWTNSNWAIISSDNHPMPASLALILSKESVIVRIFTFIGLFGLAASLQGVAIASVTQFEYLIGNRIENYSLKRKISSLLVFGLSIFSIWGSHTAFLIELSVFGAVLMYFGVSISLLKIRYLKSQNSQKVLEGERTTDNIISHQDFNPLKSNIFSIIASIISLLCISILIYLHPYVFTSFVVIGILYIVFDKFKR